MTTECGEFTWRTWIYSEPSGIFSALITQGCSSQPCLFVMLALSSVCYLLVPEMSLTFAYLANDLMQLRLGVAGLSPQFQETMGGIDRYLPDSLKPQTLLRGIYSMQHTTCFLSRAHIQLSGLEPDRLALGGGGYKRGLC